MTHPKNLKEIFDVYKLRSISLARFPESGHTLYYNASLFPEKESVGI